MFHQKVNSIGHDIYSGYLYRGHNWPMHVHKSLEFVYVIRGRLQASVGQQHTTLSPGETVFVMPYQPHAYLCENGEDTIYFIACFSKNHIPYFASDFAGREPTCSKLTLSADAAHYLLQAHSVDERLIQNGGRYHLCPTPSMYTRKAVLYAICAEIAEQTKWQQKDSDSDLITRVLTYIEGHYTENITLSDVAEHLSYEYHYLSRIFHQTLGTNFKTLVNQYRCERAQQLLIETQDPVSDIAFACGFQSIRSFNRTFSDYASATPSAIRAGRTTTI